ncbi:MAG: bacterial regulatory s, gntR family protein [Promethearchaeota archaeon CR_4]|nr:MAG: bacterial regulatory s, gntR family protein [Candidatus Lokiarchaeota archaeon CR_4]
MLIKILLESENPIYEQLRNQIIEGIAKGTLKPGECLPSVRQLALDLGINLHTVNKAYQILKQEGFFTIHRQKGVIINQKSEMQASERQIMKIKENLKPIIVEAYSRGISLDRVLEICSKMYQNIQNGEENI